MRKRLLFSLLGFTFCQFQSFGTGTIQVNQDTTWSGTILLSENVNVQSGKVLTIQGGSILKLGKGIEIKTESTAGIKILGTASQPISISPLEPGTYFHNIHAADSGSFLEMTFVDVTGGQIKVSKGATATIQDCSLHDFNLGTNPILFGIDANSVYLNRTEISNYYEVNIVRTLTIIENSLFQFPTADGIDLDNAPAGSTIRNTTIQYGRGFNIDGLDFGKVNFQPPGSQVVVENCLIHDFSDNGISIGEGALNVVVTGTLIYRTGSGIAVKDSSLATIINNTFYNCGIGVEVYEKNPGLGGGHASGYNNIFWANEISSVSLSSNSTFDLSYSNFQESIVDTTAHNLSFDPFFINASNDDYELSPVSPLRSKGRNGEDLGAIFPVGGISIPSTELRLGHPEANMKFAGDSTIYIYWAAGNNIQNVDISYSEDGGNSWQQIGSNISARDQQFVWTIPNIYSSRNFVKVNDHNDTSTYSSNLLPFSIQPVGDSTKLPSYSKRSGFYETPIDVTINSPSGSVVYYTLDGSDPNDRSPIYSSPIHFDTDSITTAHSQQYITASEFPHQPYSYIRSSPLVLNGPMHNFFVPPTQTIMKAGVLRSRIYTPGQGLGEIVTSTYFIDPMINEKFTLPIISINTDPNNLFDYYSGIYIPGATFDGNAFTGNYELSGRQAEREANFEFFKPNGQEVISQSVGLRIRGEWIRNLGQKAMTVFARSEYDEENSFNYDFFKGLKKPGSYESMNDFKRIILRNNGNEWGGSENSMCRDAVIQSLFDHLDLKYQSYTPAVAFIDGEYWGLHNIRELNDTWGIQKNYGINRDSVILMEDNLDGHFKLISGQAGDENEYINLVNFVQQNDMSIDQNYEYVKSQIDIDNFIDYWAATVYSNKTNTDHNQSYWKLRNAQLYGSSKEGHDGKWRYMAGDFDAGFKNPSDDNIYLMNMLIADSLLKNIINNAEFKTKFVTRFADLLNSSFETQRVLDKIEEIKSTIEPEMPRHIGRWNSPGNMQEWNDNVELLRNFARVRTDLQRTQLVNRFVLGNKSRIEVDVDNTSMGNIQVNTLFIDQNLPAVKENVYPWQGIYFENLPITITAIPKAGYKFVKWKGTDNNFATISFSPANDTSLTAIFERDFSSFNDKLTLFPNPATQGMVYLEDFHQVSVIDLTGKVVIPEQTTKQIDISKLSSGMYFVRDVNGQEAKLVIAQP